MNVMQLLLNKFKKQKNRLLRGAVFTLIVFQMLSLFSTPFNIYADDYSGSTIQGFNVSLIDIEQTLVNSGGTSGYMSKYIYEVEFILDDSYVGYINVSGEVRFYPYNSSTLTTYNIPGRNYFVNGNSFKLTFQLTGDGYTADNRPSLNNTVFTYGNHNLYKHSEIDSLETIIDLLTDLYNNTDTVEGLLNSQLTQLQLIAQRCNITNEYLSDILDYRSWNFPLESFNAVYYMFGKYDEVGLYELNSYKYPIFKVQNGVVAKGSMGSTWKMIYIVASNVNINNITQFNNFFSITDGLEFQNFTDLAIFRSEIGSYQAYGHIMKVEIVNNSGSSKNFEITFNGNSSYNIIMPIYLQRDVYKNLSTDFALQFGLSNNLLDNLNIIAQGTAQSNQSSGNLESQKGTFDTTSNNLYTSENAFNTDMNDKLQSIDTSFNPSTSFGSKFLSSADWVRTQFNNLTSTSPFGTVLSFSMLLGLSLLIVGKVFK